MKKLMVYKLFTGRKRLLWGILRPAGLFVAGLFIVSIALMQINVKNAQATTGKGVDCVKDQSWIHSVNYNEIGNGDIYCDVYPSLSGADDWGFTLNKVYDDKACGLGKDSKIFSMDNLGGWYCEAKNVTSSGDPAKDAQFKSNVDSMRGKVKNYVDIVNSWHSLQKACNSLASAKGASVYDYDGDFTLGNGISNNTVFWNGGDGHASGVTCALSAPSGKSIADFCTSSLGGGFTAKKGKSGNSFCELTSGGNQNASSITSTINNIINGVTQGDITNCTKLANWFGSGSSGAIGGKNCVVAGAGVDQAKCDKVGGVFDASKKTCSVAIGQSLKDAVGKTGDTPSTDTSSPTGGGSSGSSGSGSASTCAVELVGWIVCPVVSTLAKVADGAFSILKGFLSVNSSMFDSGSASYQAYQRFLPLANVVLAIIFLIVIYSEATGGAGIMSNYNIKKTLPRLIIFAILMNVSWYICAAAVDLTNIVGANLGQFLSGVDIDKTAMQVTGPLDGTNGIANFFGGVLAGTGALAGIFLIVVAAGGSLLLAALLLAIAMIFVLGVRQAAIILLCVISPLAFAAAILPNTKKLFDKWWSMFSKLLLLYPTIAVLYGAGTLASKVLTSSGGTGISVANWALHLVGAFMPVLVLVATPSLLKGSLDALGKVGGAITGNTLGRAGKHMTNTSKQGVKDSAMGTAWRVHKRNKATRLNRRNAWLGGVASKVPIVRNFKGTASSLQGYGRTEQNKQDQEALAEADGWVQEKHYDTESPDGAMTMLQNDTSLTGDQFTALYKQHAASMNKEQRTRVMAMANNDSRFAGTGNRYLREALAASTKDAGGSYAGGGDTGKFISGTLETDSVDQNGNAVKTRDVDAVANSIKSKAAAGLYNGSPADFAKEDPTDIRNLTGTKFDINDADGKKIREEMFDAQGVANHIVGGYGAAITHQTLGSTAGTKPETSAMLEAAIDAQKPSKPTIETVYTTAGGSPTYKTAEQLNTDIQTVGGVTKLNDSDLKVLHGHMNNINNRRVLIQHSSKDTSKGVAELDKLNAQLDAERTKRGIF